MAPQKTPPPPHNLPHFRIEPFQRSDRYKVPPSGRDPAGAGRDRKVEGARLTREFSAAYDAARQQVGAQLVNDRRKRSGVYIEVQSVPGQPIPELVWMSKGVRLGAVRPAENHTEIATVFVPHEAKEFIEKGLHSYTSAETPKGNVPLKDRFEALAEIRTASVRSLWTDRRPFPLDNRSVWWECWTWKDQLLELRSIAEQIGFSISDRNLSFPDIVIVPLNGTLAQLETLIGNTSAVEQLRYGSDSPVFFTTTVRREQKDWVDDLAKRLQLHDSDSPAVCLLDTGVARAHPLLEGSLAADDCLTVVESWGTDDADGHGTNMSGVILFSDLTAPLSGTERIEVPFILESVKLIPPMGFPATEPQSYGVITQSSVSVAEINAPDRHRAFCMAITNFDVSGELPSSWSAALDQICAGAMTGEEPSEDQKRLFFVSTGNIQDTVGPEEMESLGEFPVEDPAQSWNAVSVGGFTNKSEIHPDETDYVDWTAFAGPGELSPYSRISTDWEHSRSPIKPEIVFEAGNRALSPDKTELLAGLNSLSLLTTSKDFLTEPLTTFWATSPATAQAAGMAGRLMSHDHTWWPETIRALMIHNASWTPWMRTQMDEVPTKKGKSQLARHFGYGVPSLERSLASAENDLCMISQAEITPFFKELRIKDGKVQPSAPKLHEMHVYDLPWPTTVLQDLGHESVGLRVTLSYFIEPNLGEKTPVLPQRYRSCGLRFQMQRVHETEDAFLERLNDLARDEDANVLPAVADPDWHFGNQMINAGSVHSDVWTGTAADLALRSRIAVIPVGGWWKERTKEKRFDSSIRYSLIISISSKDNEALLYSEIKQIIETPISIEL